MATVTPTPRPRRPLRALISVLVAVVVVLAVFSQRQAIYDWWQLRNYQAPANIAALADTTTMTPQARHDFYVNHPAVEEKASFNEHCPDNGGEQTIVLGCYTPPQRGIYVYSVTDPQLKGVEEVTAAHEMLHAAYDRLDSKDRKYVNGLLQDYYNNDLHDKRLRDTFAAYQRTEPNDVVDEMHSIFGTEVANLPPALENYYKQYFTNRQAVTNFAAQYQGAFSGRQAQINQYDSQLKDLKAKIDANQKSLDTQGEALDQQRQQLNQLASHDPATYNAQVDGFNNAVNDYNALLAQTKQYINEYNNIVNERNAVAVETQDLAQELNSRLQTQSSQ